MDRPTLLRAVQLGLTAVLTFLAVRWMFRASARRRTAAVATAGGRRLAYPRWATWLGGGGAVAFSVLAWFAWHAPASRGGLWPTIAFLGFAVLGLFGMIGSRADVFLVAADGLTRRRFGRERHVAWADVARVALPVGAQGLRVERRDGTRLEVAQLMDGFGVLCDALLERIPATARVEPGAAELIVGLATLAPEALQRAYAPWFEREGEAPPPGLTASEIAEAAGRAFAQRMLSRHGSFEPFEARWTTDGQLRITHGAPRGDEPGYAAFRPDGPASDVP